MTQNTSTLSVSWTPPHGQFCKCSRGPWVEMCFLVVVQVPYIDQLYYSIIQIFYVILLMCQEI